MNVEDHLRSVLSGARSGAAESPARTGTAHAKGRKKKVKKGKFRKSKVVPLSVKVSWET